MLDYIYSFKMDFKNQSCDLCELGRKYDTDKTAQRDNVTNYRHAHPYTVFYNSLFKKHSEKQLDIAEIGIGGSIDMWDDYFVNSTIYGFDCNLELIQKYREKYDNETRKKIILDVLEVGDENSINECFQRQNVEFDFIIDDTTHDYNDQCRIIKNSVKYLKPGGLLIIEDIFKNNNEQIYWNYLLENDLLKEFQTAYFITFEHEKRCSTGWDNDKILFLVKDGAKPIFHNDIKLTIITPSCRPNNLIRVKESINFDYVSEWIIVYDEKKVSEIPQLFLNEPDEIRSKIKEYLHTSEGISGNPQRNYALDRVTNENTYLYYLDDDNIIHKDLYKLLDIVEEKKLYSFDQYNRINGSKIEVYHIDTAMVLIDFRLCLENRWILNLYNADGHYLKGCYEANKDKWIYVNNFLSYYNAV